MSGIIVIFVLNNSTLSSHMDHISEHINSPNHKIHSYDKMNRMIVNLGSKTYENNDTSTGQLTRLHNCLILIIVDIPENYLSNVDCKSDTRKLFTFSVLSSSTLFIG